MIQTYQIIKICWLNIVKLTNTGRLQKVRIIISNFVRRYILGTDRVKFQTKFDGILPYWGDIVLRFISSELWKAQIRLRLSLKSCPSFFCESQRNLGISRDENSITSDHSDEETKECGHSEICEERDPGNDQIGIEKTRGRGPTTKREQNWGRN